MSILIFISQPFKQRLPALPSVVLSGSLLHRTVRQKVLLVRTPENAIKFDDIILREFSYLS